MEAVEAGPRTVQFVVEFYGELAHVVSEKPQDAALLVQLVTRYADDLMDGLAITATASLSLTFPAGEPRNDFSQCEVLIDDQVCRQQFAWHEDSSGDVVSLRRRIERVICHNRELLVSSPQAEAMGKITLSSDSQQCEGGELLSEVHSLLVETTRWGVSWNHAKTWLQTHSLKETESRPLEVCFEELAAMGDPLQVTVSIPPNLETAASPSSLNALSHMISSKLVSELGIDAGSIVFQSLEECAGGNDDELHISINALRLAPTAIPRREQVTAPSDRGEVVSSEAEQLETVILNELRHHAGLLITARYVDARLNALGERFPVLVREAKRRFDLLTLTAVLRAIAHESISILDLRGLLDCLTTINGIGYADYRSHIVFHPNTANFCPSSLDSRIDALSIKGLAETARMSLKRHISNKYSEKRALDREIADGVFGNESTMYVLLLHPDLEERFADSADDPFSGEEISELHEDIHVQVRLWPEAHPPVILTTVDIRHQVRDVIDKEFP
ncbi:MAG TPA: hypothetical protein VGV87_19695, partial [Blastocatellia bacterium]|nr:hypothetical protein [Blastocatellia bacterium]